MFGLAEGCRRIEPKFIDDDELAESQLLLYLDRWGDRRVPKDTTQQWRPPSLWDGMEAR